MMIALRVLHKQMVRRMAFVNDTPSVGHGWGEEKLTEWWDACEVVLVARLAEGART